jgi:hypothetical protein
MTTLVVRMKPQLGTSLTDNYSSIIYDRNMFIIQATTCYTFESIYLANNILLHFNEALSPTRWQYQSQV